MTWPEATVLIALLLALCILLWIVFRATEHP